MRRQQGAKQAERREADSPADSPYCPRTTQEDAADDPLDLHTAALFLLINIVGAADGMPLVEKTAEKLVILG